MQIEHTLENYTLQLNKKKETTLEQFSEFGIQNIEVYTSPISAYRMRAEFKIWHEDNAAHYAMHKPGDKNSAYTISEFPIASLCIQQLMPRLLSELNNDLELKRRLFQVEFLSTTTEEILVTLIYHRPLNDTWMTAAKQLGEKLNINIIGRSKKQKLILDKDYVIEQFEVAARSYQYQQIEASFTQPNASVCEHMLNWAVKSTHNMSGDLLELYCGNGNFTLPLAQHFNKVLATEISKSSIKSALFNCNLNNINNIEFVRMSSEEFTQALNKTRPFKRLANLDLDSYDFTTIMVDPPRAGLDQDTLKLAANFNNILYISCNPETLQRDLKFLCKTHKVAQFALFDQFPYTEHRECGALLTQLETF